PPVFFFYARGARPPLPPFPTRRSSDLRLDRDGVHLAVFHGSLDWDAGDRSLPLMSPALAAAGYDYIALGHIHRPGEKKVGPGLRSEEHTSELQSRENLVCRLLLEKK